MTDPDRVLSTSLFGDLVLPRRIDDPEVLAARRELAAQAATLAASARSRNTLRTYRSAWSAYSAWCAQLGFEPLAGDPQQIGMYMAGAGERLAVSSLEVHLAAIVSAHRIAGQQLDPGHPSIALVMEGLRRTKGTAPSRQAAPIGVDLLARCVAAQPHGGIGLRNRAMLLTGFGAALRRSELVGLNVGDVRFVAGKGVEIVVRRSKTDQVGQGDVAAIWASDDPDLCAPTALSRWLDWLRPGDPSEPLFVGFRRSGAIPTGRRLSDKAVARLIQDTTTAVGAGDADLIARTLGSLAGSMTPRFSGHSLRSGLLTAAGEEQIPLRKAMDQARQTSPSTTLGYMRSADRWRDNPTTVMRRPR